MYSPKIREEFMPKIYAVAKARGIRMTTLVNEIIEKALGEINNNPSDEGNKQKEVEKWTGKQLKKRSSRMIRISGTERQ